MSLSPQSEYKVLDLFAGAGGFSLGFTLARYSLEYAVECDDWAADTLQVNNPSTKVIIDDIGNYQDESSIKNAVNNQYFDVVIGGPPCQGFSIAGPKKDPKDPRNSLFIDFSRWVGVLQPRFFIMENVKGIISRRNANNEKVIDIIKSTFERLGYTTEVWLLNAVDFGVPQFRERVFIVGNRLGKQIGTPKITHSASNEEVTILNLKKAITVAEAILDLPVIDAGEGFAEFAYTIEPSHDYQRWARGNEQCSYNHEAMKHTKRIIQRFEQIKRGESISDIPSDYGAQKRNGNGVSSNIIYDMNNRRLIPDKPSFTIPASFYSTFIHPFQHRNITAREAARLQSFPDFYRFMGKRTVISSKLLQRQNRHAENHLSQYNQIGNAVPPLLAKAIADHIKPFLR